MGLFTYIICAFGNVENISEISFYFCLRKNRSSILGIFFFAKNFLMKYHFYHDAVYCITLDRANTFSDFIYCQAQNLSFVQGTDRDIGAQTMFHSGRGRDKGMRDRVTSSSGAWGQGHW